ncbi:PP2C family protein-serine/threonine phosphatase [Saliterribacillus persicus]|uniref:Sigma-B regulation protein RsbU (Phosphoserine phosphatase) n=1 Tax=Saliterribacillus persicus TaxID=930114 RepID=A0A368XXX7_9BACI|nr:PP2C family protein-serine/threonine phosphatase [Saliterribacillus persicus]RCW71888.1 sigma-B regulation protein RsbU (phosphoserine phosphatase) [Saliterribacillus persicus]
MFKNKISDKNKRVNPEMDITLAREMKQARNIQMKLLNATKPEIGNADISGVSIPARLIGGDYFDFQTLPNGKLRIIIGDVMGKGIPAAMLMILTRGAFRSSLEFKATPSETLEVMNRSMYNDLKTLGSFVTLLCADWDPDTNALTYSSAGHNLPIIVNKKSKERELVKQSGVMIGGLADSRYIDQTITLSHQDMVFFYTDGIIEAQDQHGNLFRLPRLVELLKTLHHFKTNEIEYSIKEEIDSFTNGIMQKDDITMLILKVNENDK